MAYPPIPRDPNGVPLPVVWDDEIKNWKTYSGMKHLVDLNGQPLLTTQNPGVVKIDDTNPPKVSLSGTLTELFGESLSDRPPANSVSVGATFMVVGDTVVYQSNGTDWVVISE